MDAGLMRHKIIIQQLKGTRNEFGETEDVWKDVASIRASINPLSGRDFIGAMKEQAEITHKVTIRYNPAVKASMRIKFGARLFRILHIIDTWEQHREMTLICKEMI